MRKFRRFSIKCGPHISRLSRSVAICVAKNLQTYSSKLIYSNCAIMTVSYKYHLYAYDTYKDYMKIPKTYVTYFCKTLRRGLASCVK